MTEYYLVDVKSITSKIPRSEFEVNDLERFAQSILKSGGLLSPLLLKQTGPEHYEVLAGDYEYYAAVRAKEINPRAGEMVNAFVISPKHEEAATEQIALLGKTKTHPQPPVGNPPIADVRLTNLESRLDEVIRDIKQSHASDIKRLEQEIAQVKNQLPQPIEPLQAFNNLSIPELVQKLAAANIRGKTAENLIAAIEKERKKSQFTSLSDIVRRIKGLGEKRMLSIIDAWSGAY
ncbi:MAG: hypothetical protein Kow00121_12490 [Elainellaceae cyanobacterium]